MISKEKFIESIQTIQDYWRYAEELHDFFGIDFSDNHISYKFIQSYQDLLEKAVNDKNEWIGYFCWELDFGKNWKYGDISDNTHDNIPLATAEDLWNIIEEDNKNEEESDT